MHFKNAAFALIITFSVVFLFTSTSSAASAFAATVMTEVLTVRSGPSTSYAKVSSVSRGGKVTVYEQKNGWFRIGTGKWVAGEYLKKGAAVESVATTFNAVVSPAVLAVRSGPGTSYGKVDRLTSGDVVKVYEQKNAWDRIGDKQWVAATYVKKTTKLATVNVESKAAAAPAPEPVVAAEPAEVSDEAEVAAPAAVVNSAPATIVKTELNTSCLKAIEQANSYCLSIARGCPSYSKTPTCLAANAKCEDRQKEALATCPAN